MARKAASKSTYAELEKILGHRFERPDRLTLALTHRSFIAEAAGKPGSGADLHDPSQDNEQLEFLGDAILGLIAAEALCRRFPGSREGDLTRLRASVISRKHLGTVGKRLNLGRFLLLGQKAEQRDGARENSALFSNAMEALIAALYLDGGLETARKFVEHEVLRDVLQETPAAGPQFTGDMGDHKSALQEMLQAAAQPRPQYRLLQETGPAHRRLFRMEVRLPGGTEPLAEAEGTSKKAAEQEAARLALKQLQTATPAPQEAGAVV